MQVGAIIGDLPPYEAFPIGGTNSVRGYSEGGVGTGRRYAVGTAELHWPPSCQLLGGMHLAMSKLHGIERPLSKPENQNCEKNVAGVL